MLLKMLKLIFPAKMTINSGMKKSILRTSPKQGLENLDDLMRNW